MQAAVHLAWLAQKDEQRRRHEAKAAMKKNRRLPQWYLHPAPSHRLPRLCCLVSASAVTLHVAWQLGHLQLSSHLQPFLPANCSFAPLY